MADSSKQITSSIDALFSGILPLMDVSCGMAAGAFDANAKNRGAGGMSAKMSPSAILVIQNGSTRLVNIKNQNTVNKVLDMIPDLVNRFSSGKVSVGGPISEEAVKAAETMARDDGK